MKHSQPKTKTSTSLTLNRIGRTKYCVLLSLSIRTLLKDSIISLDKRLFFFEKKSRFHFVVRRAEACTRCERNETAHGQPPCKWTLLIETKQFFTWWREVPTKNQHNGHGWAPRETNPQRRSRAPKPNSPTPKTTGSVFSILNKFIHYSVPKYSTATVKKICRSAFIVPDCLWLKYSVVYVLEPVMHRKGIFPSSHGVLFDSWFLMV